MEKEERELRRDRDSLYICVYSQLINKSVSKAQPAAIICSHEASGLRRFRERERKIETETEREREREKER